MCPTKKGKEAPVGSGSGGSEGVRGGGVEVEPAWMEEARSGGSLKTVDLNTGTNGWASPPGDVFNVRGPNYFPRRQKSPANPAYLLSPLGVDWLRSTGRLDDVLGRPDNLVAGALRRAQSRGESLKAFLLAVNLQVPGRDHHSAVFYFGSEEPLSPGSLLFRFVNGDDEFRNARFKIVNRIVRGPWIVRAAVGNYAACLLGRALQIRYVRGPNYLEIDVDIGSSALANAILHLALGYVTTVTIDMGFLVEAQAEEELPERLIGAVRIAHMEMGSAVPIGITESAMTTAAAASAGKHHHAKGGGRSLSKVKHVDKDGSVADEVRPNGAS
ncbi:protein ENHANCED DISEASE RESISTANCE 2-like [Nymphaea colorata]|uniref:protein ENHANCED DISEASE RESISTANCE 2-like n=1 Tax=Nymphaea colorata TaxID=210225 RepID=UPI00129E9857|nr:protein ENHANCED DISEASE RESISTANCE 2-like [Nymphaea colorata]